MYHLEAGAASEVTVQIALQDYAPGASAQQWPTDEQIERILTDTLAAIKAPVEAS